MGDAANDGDTARCSTAGGEGTGAGRASEGTDVPGEATPVGLCLDHDRERRHRDEATPSLHVANDDIHPSWATPEKGEEAPPCVHMKPEMEDRMTADNVPPEIPDQSWSVEKVTGGRGRGGGNGDEGDGDGDGDGDEATGVADDAHLPNCTHESSASSPARLGSEGSDRGTANGQADLRTRNRRGTPTSDGGTDHAPLARQEESGEGTACPEECPWNNAFGRRTSRACAPGERVGDLAERAPMQLQLEPWSSSRGPPSVLSHLRGQA